MRLIIISILAFNIYSAASQTQMSTDGGVMYINKNQKQGNSLEGKRGGFFGQHFLGDTITMAYDKFLKYYVKYETTGGAYAAEKKVIYKKPIYNAVSRLDKHIKKLVRSKDISREEGKNRFGTVLNQAVRLRFYNTEQLEKVLNKEMKNEEMLEKYLSTVVFK